MKIKTKLLLGFGLLFLVVVFFGIVAIYYIDAISENSKKTVKNNYETLTFTRDMRSVLDENDLPLSATAVQDFNNALVKQEHNITEPGEKEATGGVRAALGQLTTATVSLSDKQHAERDIRSGLKTIDGLNMNAIIEKSRNIHKTVSDATLILGGIVFITFLILFVFIVNFPGFILNPLHQFVEGIQAINDKDYHSRLELKTNDEFADLAIEFNKMAASMADSQNQSMSRILNCESQLKVIGEEMPGALLALNEKQEILTINTAARKLFDIGEKPVSGHKITNVVKENHLLTSILASKDGDKISHYRVKSSEIVIPNLKPEPAGTLQFASLGAGMIYIITEEKKVKETVKSV
jgi:NtrC-family two-component system sensor histidine kinase KinB